MKHIAKRRIKNTAQMLAILGLVGMSTFAFNAHAEDTQIQAGSHYGTPKDKQNHKQAFNAALENNNYTAFKALLANTKNKPNTPEITEAIFAKMVEAHKLKLAGDTAGAKKIMDELGLRKMKGGLHTKLTDAQKATLKEAKALRDAGKKDEAKALLEKAGIKKHIMHKHHKNTQSINSNTTTK